MTLSSPLRTPEALGIIDHVNQDHREELRLLARAFCSASAGELVELTALFESGAELRVGEQAHYLPFDAAGTLRSALVSKVEQARQQLGEAKTIRVFHWQLAGREELAQGFWRLHLAAQGELPDITPGFAQRFVVAEGVTRPYTLCQQGERIWLDVLTGHDGPGAAWAAALRPGDAVESRGGKHKEPPASPRGAALLADASGLPAVAAMLAACEGDAPPQVLLELSPAVAAIAPQYLGGQPAEVFIGGAVPGQALEAGATHLQAGAIWGATEKEAAQRIREGLRERLGLSAPDCRVAGYWKAEEA